MHVLPVAVTEARQHPLLLVPGQEAVKEEHERERGQNDEARPEDGHADAPEPQEEVLRMADAAIEPLVGDAPLQDLAQIHLPGAHEKAEGPDEEQARAQDAHGPQKRRRRQDHMWQKERREPARGPVGIQPVQDGIEHGVEEEGKGTDHDHDLEGHDEEQEDAALGGDLLDARNELLIHETSPMGAWIVAEYWFQPQ